MTLSPLFTLGDPDAHPAEFGRRMHTQGIVLRGRLSEDRWLEFLAACTAALGMSPTGAPALWRYPTEDGKGGEGMTICQPITESFLALDTWGAHDGAYLFVCSCKKFSLTQIAATVREFGLGQEDNTPHSTLRL